MTRAFLLSVILAVSPQNNRGSIEGRVVRLASGAPVVRATVLLAKIEGQLSDYQTTATTDGGTFAFRNLAPGRYRVFAEGDDYVRTEHGQSGASPSGVPITVKSEAIKGITVTLTPTGTVAGRVFDADGNPAADVWVYASRPSYANGERALASVQPLYRTDDLGEYRIFGLVPGLYFISAVPFDPPRIEGENYVVPSRLTPPGGYFRAIRGPAITPGTDALATGIVDPATFVADVQIQTYHPGTTDSSKALPVDVRPGVTVGGLDLRLARVRAVEVRGRVVDSATGRPVENISLSLASRSTLVSPSIPTRSQAGQVAGVFVFRNVIPGAYEVRASSQARLGRAAVDVGNQSVDGVSVILQPPLTIQGRVRVDGRRTPDRERDPELAGIAIQVLPGGPLTGYPVQPDRTVAIETGPGDYRFALLRLPPHLYAKSIRLGPTEILSSSIQIGREPGVLEIVLSTNGGRVRGVVVDSTQQPVAGSRVALVPGPSVRTRFDLYKTAMTDMLGQWEIEGIAPGDYRLFAWQRIEADAWQDPGVLLQYENQGTGLTIAERDKRDVRLRVIPSSSP